MNRIKTINTEYLRASRTIEIVEVTNEKSSNIFFVYNYEGNSFRLFTNHLGVINFFQNNSESDFHFGTESELDNFLSKIQLTSS